MVVDWLDIKVIVHVGWVFFVRNVLFERILTVFLMIKDFELRTATKNTHPREQL